MAQPSPQDLPPARTVISPPKGWLRLELSELWRYRDLIRLFVRRDFVSLYKQTVLGPLWFVLQPLISSLVFTVVFGKIARIPTEGAPPMLFYMGGLVIWSYFNATVQGIANTFRTNQNIFGKVYFPRLVVPVAAVVNNLIMSSIQFATFLAFLGFYALRGAKVAPNLHLLLVPLLVLMAAALALGVGLMVAALTTRYRDLMFLLGFGMQLWMYATPIVYPLSSVPESWRWLSLLNPMTAVVSAFRHAFLGGPGVAPWALVQSGLITALLLLTGLALFGRQEKTFMDTI